MCTLFFGMEGRAEGQIPRNYTRISDFTYFATLRAKGSYRFAYAPQFRFKPPWVRSRAQTSQGNAVRTSPKISLTRPP
jgi:hypothetical protein